MNIQHSTPATPLRARMIADIGHLIANRSSPTQYADTPKKFFVSGTTVSYSMKITVCRLSVSCALQTLEKDAANGNSPPYSVEKLTSSLG